MGDHIEPGQMDIFDILEEPKEVFAAPARTVEKTAAAASVKLNPQNKNQIRLNEYHFDKRYANKELMDWAKANNKKVGDLFTIAEVNEFNKKGVKL